MTLSPTCGFGHEFTPENTGQSNQGRRYCKQCKRNYTRKWVQNKRQTVAGIEELKAYQRKWAKKRNVLIRQEVLDHYGRECACCGESEEAFLALDHINDDGAEHRRTHRLEGNKTYYWAKNNGWPAIFQMLCHNCNFAKGRGGCPHVLKRRIAEAS